MIPYTFPKVVNIETYRARMQNKRTLNRAEKLLAIAQINLLIAELRMGKS